MNLYRRNRPSASGLDPEAVHLVSRLADIYGGSVELEESPNGGAQFRVRLPTTDDDPSDQVSDAGVDPFNADA